MKIASYYVKGHMGGNLIALLYGEDLEELEDSEKLEVALKAIDFLGVHEAGLLHHPRGEGHLYVKIVGRSSRHYITACGGLTQVLGKAVLETRVGTYFNIECQEPLDSILLETDGGLVELMINTYSGKVITDMSAFVEECYREGITPLRINKINVAKVGKFLVVNASEIRKRYPLSNFSELDSYSKALLQSLQRKFQDLFCPNCFDFALYDHNPKHLGHIRAVFPHNVATGHIEPSCGTGSVAISLASWHYVKRPYEFRRQKEGIVLLIETGKEPPGLGGPDLTRVELRASPDRVFKAYFTHSRVEILQEGVLELGD